MSDSRLQHRPMAIMARFLTASRGLESCGKSACCIPRWKLTNRPTKHILSRAVPNIRFVFASAPNSGPNRLFVFGRIVLPRPNTNSALQSATSRHHPRVCLVSGYSARQVTPSVTRVQWHEKLSSRWQYGKTGWHYNNRPVRYGLMVEKTRHFQT